MTMVWKDYRLQGGPGTAAPLTAEGFTPEAEQAWYACPIDRKTFKALIKRSDGPALALIGLWLGLLAVAGVIAFLSWGSWWAIPAFLAYGILYSAADHRHHELSHGTVFRTRWLNDVFFHLCAFMTLREGFYYRWSHTRHHTHTIIVGKDPEIGVPRPAVVSAQILDFFFLHDGVVLLRRLWLNASGQLTEDGRHFVPDASRGAVIWASRLYLAILLGIAALCVALGSLLPAMFVILPRFYGGVLSQFFNLTQHAGLDEDVHDHRLNTRTVLMNPVFRFLYANMNYHIEHHMFPMVPFHRLPALHRLIRSDCPPPYPSLYAAWTEILPAIWRQRREPGYFVQRPLPPSTASLAPVAA